MKKRLYPSWENVPKLLEGIAGGLVWVGVLIGLFSVTILAALIYGIVWYIKK